MVSLTNCLNKKGNFLIYSVQEKGANILPTSSNTLKLLELDTNETRDNMLTCK